MEIVLTPLVDQLGHINPHYEDDFLSRSANDRVSPRGDVPSDVEFAVAAAPWPASE